MIADGPRTPKVETPKPTGKRAKKLGSHFYRELTNWAVPFVEGADLHVVRRTNELTINHAGLKLLKPLGINFLLFQEVTTFHTLNTSCYQ
jgi:hypothetical protein